jgi:hypothetical protein
MARWGTHQTGDDNRSYPRRLIRCGGKSRENHLRLRLHLHIEPGELIAGLRLGVRRISQPGGGSFMRTQNGYFQKWLLTSKGVLVRLDHGVMAAPRKSFGRRAVAGCSDTSRA